MLQRYQLKKIFQEYMNQAQPTWDEFWDTKINSTHADFWEIEAYNQYKAMMKGGKHLRACLVILGWRLAGKDPSDKRILKASGSIEVLHNAFLIHDDIVDKSILRRNLKTVHERFKDDVIENKGTSFDQAKDFGVSVALNIGDLGQALAQEILMQSNFNPSAIVKAIGLFNEHLQHTVLGQMYDLDLLDIEELTEEYVERIHQYKTAYYTFVFPILLGFFLGEGEDQLTETIREYGILTGIVYQMRDDFLGLFGEEVSTGKSIDSDLTEGKKTLFIVKALEAASESEKSTIKQAFGNRNASFNQLEEVRAIVKKTGALQYSEEKTNRLVLEANRSIEKLSNLVGNSVEDVLDILREVTRYVSERDN